MATRHEQGDQSGVVVQETSDLVTITREEYERLIGMHDAPNPMPAVEEGPHLTDPDIAAAKRQQLQEFGVAGDEDWLSDDMRRVLVEG